MVLFKGGKLILKTIKPLSTFSKDIKDEQPKMHEIQAEKGKLKTATKAEKIDVSRL